MSECIGLDFGTTYTALARLNNIQQEKKGKAVFDGIETIEINGKDTFDSLVIVDENDNWSYGSEARYSLEYPDIRVFEGFKMLLAEQDEEILKQNGFAKDEPEKISRYYLNSLIEEYKHDTGENINSLVVGVPEVWFQKNVSSRNKLQAILEDIVGKGKVQLKSEPELATAYFAYNHKEKTKEDFVGKVLVIDYGGGTLDVTLCDVGREEPRIAIKFKTGEGANERTKLGDAGLAFIDAVVEIAITEDNGNTLTKDNEFFKCQHQVENFLISKSSKVEKHFKMEIDEDDDDEFCKIIYRSRPYVVTYGMLVKAYNSTIRNVLGRCLDKVSKELKRQSINYESPVSPDFRIAMVGGFCSFYLTQHQILHTPGFKWGGENDLRYKELNLLFADISKRKKAVAYGAALMANGVYTSKDIVHYSLYLVKKDETEAPIKKDKNAKYVVFREGDEIEVDVPQMVRKEQLDSYGNVVVDEKTGKPCYYIPYFSVDNIPFVQYVCSGLGTYKKPAGLDNINLKTAVQLGFALDKNSNLSLYIFPKGQTKPIVRSLERNIEQLLGGFLELNEEDAE